MDGPEVGELEIDLWKLPEPDDQPRALLQGDVLNEPMQYVGVWIDCHYMTTARKDGASGETFSAADVERYRVDRLRPDHKLESQQVEIGDLRVPRAAMAAGGRCNRTPWASTRPIVFPWRTKATGVRSTMATRS